MKYNFNDDELRNLNKVTFVMFIPIIHPRRLMMSRFWRPFLESLVDFSCPQIFS